MRYLISHDVSRMWKWGATEHSLNKSEFTVVLLNAQLGNVLVLVHPAEPQPNCWQEQFRQCFSTYGSITKVELHALRGFGYITYDTVEAPDRAREVPGWIGRYPKN